MTRTKRISDPVKLLRKLAAVYLARPGKWYRDGWFSVNSAGNQCEPESSKASRFCLVGGLKHFGTPSAEVAARLKLHKILEPDCLSWVSLTAWNDKRRSVKPVITLLRKAAAL
jgi:hypothetical protein